MTFSFHVLASDEIKCYLVWNGQYHRFYPQDIINVLPTIFVKSYENNKFATSREAMKLINDMYELIRDNKFEEFHRTVNGMKENEFPLRYKYR